MRFNGRSPHIRTERTITGKFHSIDDYIASFPADVQLVLHELRSAIRRAAPGSAEIIRYDMPTTMLDGRYLVHFAAWKRHIGLYPIPYFDGPLNNEIAPYRAAKDTVRLPYNKPIPYDLVERLVAELVKDR